MFGKAGLGGLMQQAQKMQENMKKAQAKLAKTEESHNVTNKGTLNNRLADILARQTDALILASATPHNGDPKS